LVHPKIFIGGITHDSIQRSQPFGNGDRGHGWNHPLLEGPPGHETGIAFFEWPGVEAIPHKDHGRPVKGPFIFDHVSFGVETEEDLWQLKDKLSAAGFHVSDVIDHGFIHSIYAFDPNGIPIEFSHNVEGVDVRANPQMADSDPSAVTREGPEPNFNQWPRIERPTPQDEWEVYPGAGSELFHGIKKSG
jgi:catechol 2,3-dioxygenase-like lactoylglutathione lyase family enzyme